jgi:hypothetical protein
MKKYKYIIFEESKVIDALASRFKNADINDLYISKSEGFIMFNDLEPIVKKGKKYKEFDIYKIVDFTLEDIVDEKN